MSNPASQKLAWLPFIAWSLGACSWVVDAGREQCSTTEQCLSLGPEFAGSECVSSLCRLGPDLSWTCLDEDAPPSAALPNQVRVIVPLLNVVTDQPTPGVDVLACERIDADCLMPIASSTSGMDGEVDLRLPGGFNGYLQLEAEEVHPMLFFFGTPLVEDSIVPVTVITREIFERLNQQFQDQSIAGRSAVVVYVRDCNGAPGVGVRLSIPEGDAGTRVFYMVDGLFPASQMETTGAGLARVLNVRKAMSRFPGC